MAGIIATKIDALYADQNINFESANLKGVMTGAFDAFVDHSNSPNGFVTNSLKEMARNSWNATMKIPVWDGKKISVTTTRPITIPLVYQVSALETLSFATIQASFAIGKYEAEHNHMTQNELFAKNLRDVIDAMRVKLEESAVATLAADRNQATPATVGHYTWDGTNDVANVALADHSKIFGELIPIFMGEDINLPLHLIQNAGTMLITNPLRYQGAGNATNFEWQFTQKVYNTNKIANAANKIGTCYAVPDGTLGFLTRYRPEEINSLKTLNGVEFGVTNLPNIPFPVGTFYKEDVLDMSGETSSANQSTRTAAEYYSFAIDVCFVTKYIKDRTTQFSPILKIQLADA